MEPRKINIQKTEYIEDKHLILWQIMYADPTDPEFGKCITLAYRANDLASAVLNRPDVVIAPEHARFFNQQILGKTINLVQKYQNVDPTSIVNGELDSLIDRSFDMKEYPFEEVYDLLVNSE